MRPFRRFLLLSAAVLAAGAAAVRAEDLLDREREMGACRALMADRDWAGAERALDAFVAKHRGGEIVEEAALLLGRARLAAGRPADALATLSALVEASPDGLWTDKARWTMADAYASLRNWKGAADLLRARDEFLASDDHRRSIADLYLAVADEAYDGREVADGFGRRTRVHDWARARDFYGRARAVALREGDGARVAHRIARSALESGDPAAAAAEWERLLREGTPGPLAAEATFGLGRALAASGNGAEARRRFREVADRWTDTEFAPGALVALGETWRPPLSPATPESLRRCLDAWREFRAKFSGHADGPAVAYRIGLELANAGDRPGAVKEWGEFVERWPRHDLAPEAVHGIALARLGLEDFDGAAASCRDLLARWPNHALWSEARALLPRVAMARAEAEMREKRWDGAVAAFRSGLEEFPADGDAPLARLRLGDALKEKGDRVRAMEEWRLVPAKHPEDPRAATAWKRVADLLAGDAGDLPAAIREYEGLAARYGGTPEGQEARRILGEMKGKFLEAALDSPLTTDRKPRVRLRLRNVERLRMKAYRLDLAEFVRTKGSLQGAEAVVTDVVKPDADWVWQPESYEDFRLLERTCEVPVKGPGAWILRAQDEELSATILVLSTDLGVVVKRSPGQTLVFVQDERTGAPAPGAAVLLADGTRAGATGEDGVWIGPALGGGILAGKDGSLAFAGGPTGPSTSFGYSPKVYLFTDRPLYRPGQDAALKGFARRVEGGAYLCREGEKVGLTVEDPRGTTVLAKEVRTDRFGGFETAVPVTPGAPLGSWRVTAAYADRTFATTFEVREFRKPEVEIDLRGDRPTWLAGEEVKASVTVRYGAGGLVRNAPLRWRVGRQGFSFDGSDLASFASWFRDPAREAERRRRAAAEGDVVEVASGEVLTDARGAARIAFPTEAGERDAKYVLEVMVRDSGGSWVRDAAEFPVTTQGFYAVVRAERRVYRPKEEMALEVFTVDANQSPVAAEGRVVVVRRRVLGNRTAEEEVSSVPVATGADGRAAVKVKADRPGEYALLFSGKDARGTVVEGRAPVTLAGEAEDLSKDLRLVCDRETYREGDEAEILVNVPQAPCSVLLTFEGERVLEHRVLRAAERSATVKAVMRPLFSPNVFVRATILREGALRESGDEVLVFRYLQVSLEPEKAEARPGEKVGLLVRTTDQRGNPVPAGVAVAAVDRAILALQPDRTPDPRPFFYDQRRTLGVATAGSVAFLPAGVTRPTNRDLLFEEARRLGRAGYERMMRHVEEGRAALDRGDLDAAVASLNQALEASPGHYEARVLLGRATARIRALEEAKAGADADGAALSDRLSREELRRKAESFEKGLDAKDKSREPAKSPAPASPPAARADGPARARRAPGAPAEGGPMTEASLDEGEEDARDAEVADVIGVGGGAGGMFGSRRGGHRDLKLVSGGGAWGGAIPPLPVPASLRERFEDAALWAPSVATGEDGTARLEVDLPDNLTTWRIVARGASADTLVGEGRASLAVRLPLLVRAEAPRFLGQRDESVIATVVHNETGGAVDVEVSLSATGIETRGAAATKVRLEEGEVRALPWTLAGSATGLATLEAKALSSAASDAQRIGLPVLPHGLRSVSAASGDLRDTAVASLDLPQDVVPGSAAARVALAPSLDRVLLDAVSWTGGFPWGCVEQTVHRFLPALASDEALRRAGAPDLALRDGLRDRVERGLLALYALQREDGGFGWASSAGAADPVMTGFAVMGMLRAERQGYALSPSNRARAVEAARNLSRGADPDARALLLQALAEGGAADAGDLNALHRSRESLSDAGLARLALAMALTGRRDRAAECVALLRGRAVAEGDRLHWEDGTRAAKRRGLPLEDEARAGIRALDAEPTALALRAFLEVEADDPVVDPAVRWLLANRRGPCWRSTRDTGAVVDALAAVLVRRGIRAAEGTVRVFVNDGPEPAATLELRGGAAPEAAREAAIPAAALRAGRNTIRLEKSGGGAVHWTAVAEAIVDRENIGAEGNLLRTARRYVRYFPRREIPEEPSGEPVPGWNCCDPASRPGDAALPSLARVGSGDLFRVTLTVEAREAVDYVLLEDPVPAGCDVVEGREEGPFERFERRDDRAVFFLSRVPAGTLTLSYVAQGVFPGSYHAMPAEAWGMYEPEVRGRSAEALLAVEAEGGVVGRRGDAESITPDEVLFAARRAFAASRWEEAREGFRALLGGWKLLPEVEAEAWAAVRTACLRLGDARGAVEAHETLMDRDPRRVPSTEGDALEMAKAYHGIGEHERAAALFRGLADRFYAVERAVSDAYESIGERARALVHRAETLLRYPDGALSDAEEMALVRA
ncbi:MAG: MG2 domain-containing protein, partial [Planctomycetes bacterium]|nr:MG2 domain-containing protein [Planctomycetota bacterium]